MTKKILAAVLGVSFAVGCGGGGGGSGVDGDKRYVDMNASEREDFCEYLVDLAGPPRTITCNGEEEQVGVEGTPAEIQACVADLGESATNVPNCQATVSQVETCYEALAADECTTTIPPACQPLFTAECTGQ